VLVQDYVIDLDPVHRVLRLKLRRVLTDQLLLDTYRLLQPLVAQGGPYAAIFDGSELQDVEISFETVRSLVQQAPLVPAGRPRVVVVNRIIGYSLARMFESARTSMGVEFHIVWSVDEAYAMLGVGPKDFSQRLFPEDLAA
jgi:hypothetical protein